jgi:DTW domain-containing protein YfiP
MHRTLCLCPLLPRLETRTRVVLVRHQLEERKTTNTGRLVELCLPACTVVRRGAEAPDDPSPLWSQGPAVLLFPHADARPLADWRDSPSPLTLVVPDATWRQAGKFRRRVPGLDRIPCAALPPVAPSRFRLRRALRPHHLSTAEAIARALGLLEDPELERRLDEVFRVMVDRTLWTNGRLPASEVTGGIPEGVRSHAPLGR